MAAQPWQWRRLTDEQLEAAAVHWLDEEGAWVLNHGGQPSESLGRITSQILNEMNRRCIELRLFEPGGGEQLYGAM